MVIQKIYFLLTEDYRKGTKAFALKQMSKFGLIGMLNTIIGYGAFVLFLNYFNYMESLIISHIIGVTHSYLWNKFWIFKSNKNPMMEFIKFNSVYLVVFVINALALATLVNALKFDPKLGQLVALPIVTITSFIGHKYLSFN